MASGIASRSATAGSPRVYPVGRAVLLLAVCSPTLAGRRIAVEGRRIQAIRFGRLALLIAFVDQATYAAPELERKRADSTWLATEARILEQAVERVRTAAVVLPMPLLTAFAHAAELDAFAAERQVKWTRALARVGIKRECVVHVFAGPHARPGGEPYVLRVTQHASRSARMPALGVSPEMSAHALSVWQACTKRSTATRRVGTGGRRGALWSAVFLLGEDDVAALGAELEELSGAGAALGLTIHLEAPRAPFTFG
jgi:hypothetical protein